GRTYLHDLCECAVKHGVPIFIVKLYTDEIGNGQLPEKVKQWQSEQARQAATSSSVPPRKYVLIAAAALLVAVASLGVWLYFKQSEITSLVLEKTIAVLPFQNLSPNKNTEFSTDDVKPKFATNL